MIIILLHIHHMMKEFLLMNVDMIEMSYNTPYVVEVENILFYTSEKV